jgi:glycosyltransferase involved in cell wall biosynthesis
MHLLGAEIATDRRPSTEDAVHKQTAVEPRRKRICIVTNAPISQNPRVVKEAEALSAAGYSVIVLYAQSDNKTARMDRAILDRAQWSGHSIEDWPCGIRRRTLRAMLGARLRIFRALSRVSMRAPIAELAYCRYFLEQLWMACRTRADLYIGHNPQSLPIVAWAAHLTGANYGFDFEDFHLGDAPASEANSLSNRLLAVLEDRHLLKACHLTAASSGIAREVAITYGIAEPLTILNVFNWSDRKNMPASKGSSCRERLSLYWFSQLVSLDRGLQDVIRAMGRVHEPVEFHIRGVRSSEVEAELMAIARYHGVERQIIFHDLIAPQDLLAVAAAYDVGLCLEVPANLNRDICITNKIFLYMLAGLAVIASRTSGQSSVLAISPEAGFMYESGNNNALATIINRLAGDRSLLERTKTCALQAAHDRWNWERESQVLIAAVDRVNLNNSARKLAFSADRRVHRGYN